MKFRRISRRNSAPGPDKDSSASKRVEIIRTVVAVTLAVAMIGTGARRPTLAFLGWFGPRGLASIVFAILVLEEGGLPHDGLILTTTYVTIGLSVLAHGLTAAPLANRYATWYESHPRDALPSLESSDVREVRWRFGVGHSRVPEPRGGG